MASKTKARGKAKSGSKPKPSGKKPAAQARLPIPERRNPKSVASKKAVPAPKAKRERKAKTPTPAVGSVPGHNGSPGALTDSERQALHWQHVKAYERDLAAKKASDAALRNTCKLIKAEGGSVRAVKLTIELKTPEGEEAFRARLAEETEVAQWNGVGVQIDLFADERQPAAERAFADGKRDGLAGNKRKPNHDPSTEQYRRYMDGYAEGNAELASANFKKLTPVEQAAAEPQPQPSQSFDDAIGDAPPVAEASGNEGTDADEVDPSKIAFLNKDRPPVETEKAA